MNGAFYIGATGLEAQQRALDIVANNIGNINTNGFKRSSVRFSELLTTRLQETDRDRADTLRAPDVAGVTMRASAREWGEGAIRQTGDALDLAIDGAGFIEVLGGAGRSLLWRGGTLKVNADGALATADGLPLRASISVPNGASDIAVDRDGVVTASVDGQEGQQIGRIELVMAKDRDALVAAGAGYYEATDASDLVSADAGEDGAGRFVQGALEGSNVELSEEMVSLLLLQRAFGANAQVVQAGDQLMGIVNGLRR